MEDTIYLLSLAFSGSDLPRALWLGFFGALLCSSRFPPVKMGTLIFLIDRIWPFAAMGFSGYGAGEIAGALSYTLKTLHVDAIPLMIRAMGLYLMVSVGYAARLMLHGYKPQTKPAKPPLPY
ncbi:MAG: hypothetical protein AAF723_10360 [Pseudomonadota bacterium]